MAHEAAHPAPITPGRRYTAHEVGQEVAKALANGDRRTLAQIQRMFFPQAEPVITVPPPEAALPMPAGLALSNERLSLYMAAATRAGMDFAPRDIIFDHLMTDYTEVEIPAAGPLAGVRVSLHAGQVDQTLSYRFDRPAFVERIGAATAGVRLTADGQHEPGQFEAASSPLDYIWASLSVSGSGDSYQSDPVPLSVFVGPEFVGHLFGITPLMDKGTEFDVVLTIVPPDNVDNVPSWTFSVGQVNVTFYTKRWERIQKRRSE